MGKRVEIIAVGNEVLRGRYEENNAIFLSRVLTRVGLEPWRISILPDNEEILAKEFRASIERSRVIIVTGGLGPTVDDVTKEAAIRALGGDTETRKEIVEEIESHFRERGREIPRGYREQERIPRGADILPNTVGLAVGLRVEKGGAELFLLPGVPEEMKEMFERSVLPTLSPPGKDTKIVYRTFALTEMEVEERLRHIVSPSLLVDISLISGPSGVDIHVPSEVGVGELIVRELGSYRYAAGDVEMEEVVLKLLRDKKKKLSTAESVTGGLLASRLLSVPGASECFLEGFITYSDEAKVERIGVPATLLERHGAVSREVAVSMATGARERAGTDFTLSTTGIAGPGGGTPTKSVGLCYVSLAAPGETFCRKLQLFGTREAIRNRVSGVALDLLRLQLIGDRGRLKQFGVDVDSRGRRR